MPERSWWTRATCDLKWPVSLKRRFKRVWWFQKTYPFSATHFHIFLTFNIPLPGLGFFLQIAYFCSVSQSPSFFIWSELLLLQGTEDRITQTERMLNCRIWLFCVISLPTIHSSEPTSLPISSVSAWGWPCLLSNSRLILNFIFFKLLWS